MNRSAAAALLLLVLVSPVLAQGSPPAPGYVWPPSWIYVPGISSTGNFLVQWGTASGATDYELEESADGAFTSPTLVYQGPNQAFNATGRANGAYYYRVRGINTVYSTSGQYLAADHPHVVDSAAAPVPAAPNPPTGVTVPANSGSGIVPISWTAVSGAAAYDLQANNRYGGGTIPPPSPNFWSGYSIIATGAGQSPYDYTATPLREYQFQVRCYVFVGTHKLYSHWSLSSSSCIVDLGPVGDPSSVTVPASSATGAYAVSWTTAANAATYELEEAADGAFTSPVQVYAGSALSFQVTGKADGACYYRVRGLNPIYTGNFVAGANPCTVSLRGTLTVAAGPSNFTRTELPGATGVSALQIALTADSVETITLTALVTTEAGTLSLSSDVTAAKLYLDSDGDGLAGAGEPLLGTGTYWASASFSFSGLTTAVGPGSTVRLVVVYDLASSVPLGAMIYTTVARKADVTVSGSLTAAPTVAGPPIAGAVKTVGWIGSLALVAGAANPPDGSVLFSAQSVPVLHVQAVAGSVEPVYVSTLSVSGSGTGNEAASVEAAFLYLDADANGAFDESLDTLLSGPVAFASDDGRISFPAGVTVPAGASRSFFVVYDFGTQGNPGETFRAGIAAGADVGATGTQSNMAVAASGAPVLGGIQTLTVPPPPSGHAGGSCGGGTGPAGPEVLLCWILLAGAWIGARRVHLSRTRGRAGPRCEQR